MPELAAACTCCTRVRHPRDDQPKAAVHTLPDAPQIVPFGARCVSTGGRVENRRERANLEHALSWMAQDNPSPSHWSIKRKHTSEVRDAGLEVRGE